jgi:hypothetical protein
MVSRILLGVLLVVRLFGAADTPLDRSTLRGLKALNVVVDRLDPELANAGISPDALQARLTRRLETADIGVDPKAPEFLGLRIMHVRGAGRRGPYALCVTLGVYQPVTLVRAPQTKTATQTWEIQTVLMSDPKGLADSAVRAADELLDGFVVAYRSVNPAGAATETPAVK